MKFTCLEEVRKYFEITMKEKHRLIDFDKDATGFSYSNSLVAWAWAGFLEAFRSGFQQGMQDA